MILGFQEGNSETLAPLAICESVGSSKLNTRLHAWLEKSYCSTVHPMLVLIADMKSHEVPHQRFCEVT